VSFHLINQSTENVKDCSSQVASQDRVLARYVRFFLLSFFLSCSFKTNSLISRKHPLIFHVLSVTNYIIGPEWESSDEEAEKVPPVKDTKGAKKSLKKDKQQSIIKLVNNKTAEEELDDEDVSVLYIGHLPAEFTERDLRTFLMQFGKVERIRVSRSVKTGNPRGYAFVKFTVASDAKIVAETLQGYFLGQRRLVCHLVPNAHARMFYDSDKVIARRKVHQEQQKKQHNRNLTNVSKLKEITARLVLRERKKRSKLAELGIDYEFPGYEDNVEDPEQLKIRKKRKNSKDENESSLKEILDEAEAANEPGSAKKTKKQKDSIGSTSASPSKQKDTPSKKGTPSKKDTPTKKGKRKDSVSSDTASAKKSSKDESSLKEILDDAEAANKAASAKKKQKDSISSTPTRSSPRKRKSSSLAEESNTNKAETPSKGGKGVQTRAVQSEKKNTKKNNKRRVST
jgi:nucleolar protein 15